MAKMRGSIGEMLAAAGVILSLMFVGVEIRQNTAAVRGATYQAISDQAAQSAFDGAGNDHLPRILALVRSDDPSLSDMSPEDAERLRLLYLFTVRRLENVWVQVSEGILDEEAFERFRPRVGYMSSRSFRDFWPSSRGSLSEEFVTHLEGLYPTIRVSSF